MWPRGCIYEKGECVHIWKRGVSMLGLTQCLWAHCTKFFPAPISSHHTHIFSLPNVRRKSLHFIASSWAWETISFFFFFSRFSFFIYLFDYWIGLGLDLNRARGFGFGSPDPTRLLGDRLGTLTRPSFTKRCQPGEAPVSSEPNDERRRRAETRRGRWSAVELRRAAACAI